jgi:SOS response regulatory protein OraA/RecX
MNQKDNYVKDLNKVLMNKALAYLSNFSSTENKLKKILYTFSENHFKECDIIQIQKEIISIINRCKELGYIDDEEFTKNKVKKYNNAGTSKKAIILKLQNYGIDKIIVNKVIGEFFNSKANTEFKAALIFARKKSLGPFNKKNIDDNFQKVLNKWFGSFARAGFTYEVTQKVLNIKSSFEAENFLCNIENQEY